MKRSLSSSRNKILPGVPTDSLAGVGGIKALLPVLFFVLEALPMENKDKYLKLQTQVVKPN